jgi:hypothetical protein
MPYLNDSQKAAAGNLWGIHVQKASATLPSSTTQDIFTITGGYVLVRALVGQVTVEVGAGTTPDLQVQHDPSTGTTIDVATDVVIASDEVGTLYYVEGDGTALIPISSGYAQAAAGQGFILPAGTLQIVTSETTAGATKWDLWYLPLDDGATVVSA